MSLLAVALAVTGAWFDANVAGSAKWPSGSDPVTIAGTGTWDGRGFVTETGRALAYGEAYGEGLSFAPTVARDAADGEVSFTTEMTFTARKRFAVPDGAKAAISVLGDGTDAAYYGLVTNAWVKLEGATPVLNEPATATVTLKRTDDGLLVRYAVNGTPLTADGAEWLKSSATESEVTRLSYQGTGAVVSLASEASGVANCTLTVPETIEGMTVSAVRVGGVEIPETSERVYDIPTNAVVTVAFAAEKDLVLSSQAMLFKMTQSMELPVEGRPVPISPTAITISEFMAAPTNGTDWVELRNVTNVDVDVTGWLVTDDYTKKISKWKTVEGDAVVPANGYLVVRVDSDVAAWPTGVAHAKLGLSDEGEALGLATPDGATVTSRIDFGLQFDEVSCGFASEATTLSYFREPTPGAANVTKASSFKKFDLRTSQNYAWAYGNSTDNFINEVVSRDLQGAVKGDLYSRTRPCHLFINGVYWGLYQTDERIDDHYAESYNGGDKDEYDVVRTFHDERLTFETGVVEGDDVAWRALWKLMDSGFAGANYPKACGLGPDCVRNPDYPVLLNPTNLMHYMMNVHWTANTDTPSYGPAPNNVAALRNRVDGHGDRDGFMFVLHDCEHALGFGAGKYDSDTTKYGTTEYAGNYNGTYANFAPAQLHYRLCQNEEYRMAFADQVYRHVVKKGGALTVPEAFKRFYARMSEVDNAISCEAARWGATCATKPDHELWLTNCQTSVSFIEKRTPYFLKAYRDRKWYPSVDAPTLSKSGEELADGDGVLKGAKLSLAVPDGATVYYTLDGSDPRPRGGGLDPKASAYDAAKGVVLRQGGEVRVNARARSAKGEWSALESVHLTVKAGFMLLFR